MNDDEPLAFFITWTVYGTFLQGDERGWRKRRKGEQIPQPKLARWRRDRLKYSIELLNDAQRLAVCVCPYCGQHSAPSQTNWNAAFRQLG